VFKDDAKILGSSREMSRIWHHPKHHLIVTFPPGKQLSHSRVVLKNQRFFFGKNKFNPNDTIPDYHSDILYEAMKNGWVRIYIDINNPLTNSNIEGTTYNSISKTTKWAYDQILFDKLLIAKRNSPNDEDANIHILSDESIYIFAKFGTLPKGQ